MAATALSAAGGGPSASSSPYPSQTSSSTSTLAPSSSSTLVASARSLSAYDARTMAREMERAAAGADHVVGDSDAWQTVCVRVLPLFNGEGLKYPIEDLNALVSLHIRRLLDRSPGRALETLATDLSKLVTTGMYTLNAKVSMLDDEHLVTRMVEIWSFFFGTVLPYIEGVFLPVQTNPVLQSLLVGKNSKAAANLTASASSLSASSGTAAALTALTAGGRLDVRQIVLTGFRNCVILPMLPRLSSVFSRLYDPEPVVDSPQDPTERRFGGQGPSAFDVASRFAGPRSVRGGTWQRHGRTNSDSKIISISGSPVGKSPGSRTGHGAGGGGLMSPDVSVATPPRPQTPTILHTPPPRSEERFSSNSTVPSPSPSKASMLRTPGSAGTGATFGRNAVTLVPASATTFARLLQMMSILAGVNSDDDAQAEVDGLLRCLRMSRSTAANTVGGILGWAGGGAGVAGSRGPTGTSTASTISSRANRRGWMPLSARPNASSTGAASTLSVGDRLKSSQAGGQHFLHQPSSHAYYSGRLRTTSEDEYLSSLRSPTRSSGKSNSRARYSGESDEGDSEGSDEEDDTLDDPGRQRERSATSDGGHPTVAEGGHRADDIRSGGGGGGDVSRGLGLEDWDQVQAELERITSGHGDYAT